MRLDKFLKVSRLIKRRTVAKEVTEQGRVSVNGRPAKAGTAVRIGDEIEIRYGQKTVVVKVANLKESTRKEDADQMYELVSETRNTPDDLVHEQEDREWL